MLVTIPTEEIDAFEKPFSYLHGLQLLYDKEDIG